MGRSTGSADLPLHGGRVPAWLATRMATLGCVITEAVVHHAGRDEWLRRMAHPFWFQSFGAVMGMDWHSSGITTSVMGALKRGLAPLESELGIFVCGGRGRHSRRTPAELLSVAERTGLPGDDLAKTSRLVAKVDSAAVQDGFESHAAIARPNQGTIVNLTDRRARIPGGELELVRGGPDRVVATVRKLRAHAANKPEQSVLPHLALPARPDDRGPQAGGVARAVGQLGATVGDPTARRAVTPARSCRGRRIVGGAAAAGARRVPSVRRADRVGHAKPLPRAKAKARPATSGPQLEIFGGPQKT